MNNVKVDASRFRAKLQKLVRNAPAAAEAAAEAVMNAAMAEIITTEPRDTNRLVRGYAIAANEAGLGPFAIPSIVATKRKEDILEKLARQLSFWQMIVDRYERQGRKDRWYTRAVRTRDRAAQELGKFTDTSIAVGLFTAVDPRDRTGRNSARRLLATTIREKIYGGRGSRFRIGGSVYIRIHNLEPHATLVEHNNGIVRKALAKARKLGLSAGRRAFYTKLTKGVQIRAAAGRA